MSVYHRPVMAAEVVEYLDPQPGQAIVDGTAGGGGHALLLGERLGPQGTLVLIDRDPEALEAAKSRLDPLEVRKVLIHGNFRRLPGLLDSVGFGLVDGVLLDLGISSHQLDVGERGFSFRTDAPLDMRMDPSSGEPASDLIARLDRKELTRIMRDYGEERWAARIAEFIERERGANPIRTTMQLADIVKAAIPRKAWPRDIHPATRVFQALRLAVNDELGALEEAIDGVVTRLSVGGRIAVISYHSLEDRIVKRAFLRYSGRCQCPPGLPECRCGARRLLNTLTRKPVVPGEIEIRENPRARSAKLRVAERVKD